MEQYRNQGVWYSKDYFTEDVIEALFKPPERRLLGAGEDFPTTFAQLPPGDADSAFAAAWAEVSADPELARALADHNYSMERGLADFKQALAAPVTGDLEMKVSAVLKVAYVTEVRDEAYVHRINGNAVLQIPVGVRGAAVASNNAEVWLYTAFVVVDFVALIAAIQGVSLAVQKVKLAPRLNWFVKLFNLGPARQLRALTAQEKQVELVLRIAWALRGTGAGLKGAISQIVESMTPLEKALAVLQLAAAIALVVVSGGTTLAVRLVQLGAAVAFLVSDVVFLANALEKRA